MPSVGKRKSTHGGLDEQHQPKKLKALFGEDGFSDVETSESGSLQGVALRNAHGEKQAGFTINEDYAKRFEHNKKREELERLQDKYEGRGLGSDDDNSSESSSDTEEDDDGILASGVLDDEVQKTLDAIQRKDPRVYNSSTVFYTEPIEQEENTSEVRSTKEKPVFLHDYQRRMLLDGDGEQGGGAPLPTYEEEQKALKASVVKEMHSMAGADPKAKDESANDNDGFLVRKSITNVQAEKRALKVEEADKDPDQYLANFMSGRAWIPTDSTTMQPFESDDDEDDRQADNFEEAYNMRFEHPGKLNEKLVTHSRDAVVKYSVRKESLNARQKAREADRARKDDRRQTETEEKARLRKLKISELEEKIQAIREAAGSGGASMSNEDWTLLIDGAWDDSTWNDLMSQRFGEEYYKDSDVFATAADGTMRRKPKKPKWKDDIDIEDIARELESTDEKDALQHGEVVHDAKVQKGSTKNSKESNSLSNPRNLRLERRKVEELVDEELDTNEMLSNFGKKHATKFRYRETSPNAWGLTAADILMADDSHLNQFVGLKKLAAFRDPEKKRKDQKRVGKKGRLKQWRMETFGNREGPPKVKPLEITSRLAGEDQNIEGVKKEKKKGRKKKGKAI